MNDIEVFWVTFLVSFASSAAVTLFLRAWPAAGRRASRGGDADEVALALFLRAAVSRRRHERRLRQLVEAFRWKARLCRGEFEPSTGINPKPPADVVYDLCADDLEAVLDGNREEKP